MASKKEGLERFEEILKTVTGLNPDLMPKGNLGRAYLREDVSEAILKEFPQVKEESWANFLCDFHRGVYS